MFLKLRDHCGKGTRNISARRSGNLCLLVVSEATPIKSHQHYCLNMNRTTRTTIVDKPKWTGERPWSHNPTQTEKKKKAPQVIKKPEVGESVHPSEEHDSW